MQKEITRIIRKILVTVIGVTILLIGLIAIFLPGPAIIIIPLGLLILASEYYFISKFLQQINRKMMHLFCKKNSKSKICQKLRQLQTKLEKEKQN